MLLYRRGYFGNIETPSSVQEIAEEGTRDTPEAKDKPSEFLPTAKNIVWKAEESAFSKYTARKAKEVQDARDNATNAATRRRKDAEFNTLCERLEECKANLKKNRGREGGRDVNGLFARSKLNWGWRPDIGDYTQTDETRDADMDYVWTPPNAPNTSSQRKNAAQPLPAPGQSSAAQPSFTPQSNIEDRLMAEINAAADDLQASLDRHQHSSPQRSIVYPGYTPASVHHFSQARNAFANGGDSLRMNDSQQLHNQGEGPARKRRNENAGDEEDIEGGSPRPSRRRRAAESSLQDAARTTQRMTRSMAARSPSPIVEDSTRRQRSNRRSSPRNPFKSPSPESPVRDTTTTSGPRSTGQGNAGRPQLPENLVGFVGDAFSEIMRYDEEQMRNLQEFILRNRK